MTQSQTITVAAVALVAVVAVGGGLAYAAKDAKEGDMLYSLHASLYGGSMENDAQSDLDAARDAYDEAVTLRDNGQLTASEQARISATYSARINALMDRIARLEADGEAQAAVELRTNLRAIMRNANDLFPNTTSSSSTTTSSSDSSMDGSLSSGMSVSSDDMDSSTSNGMTGASSSIFVQPSSSVTSA